MKKILKLIYIVLGSITLMALVGFGSIAYFSMGLPEIASLNDYRPVLPSQILSSDGTVLAFLGQEKREVVQTKDIPKKVVDAFLAAEDDNFFNHSGVDYLGVARAMIANLKAGRVVQGGSTITQQVAKSFLTKERSYSRKIKDFLLAIRIEKKLSKQDILFLYLNQAYLGGGYYGIKMAAKGYYDKELSEMTSAESAMLAGLLVAPGKYSPYNSPKFAVARQHYVLQRLRDTKKITEEEYQAAIKEEIKFRLSDSGSFKAGYFTDWVRQQVVEKVGEEKFLTEGLTVKTTLNYELQIKAEKAVTAGAKEVDKRQGYKGPLGRIEIDKELFDFQRKFRQELFKSQSNYFTITDKSEKKFEIDFGEDEFLRATGKNQKWDKNLKNESIFAGFDPADSLVNQLKEGASYEGVVLKASNSLKIVAVDLGGVVGIIPQTGFSWAKKRTLSEDSFNWSTIENPSDILKAGDKILVAIKKKGISLWSLTSSATKKKWSSDKRYSVISEQKYIELELDQEPDVQAALYSIHPKSGDVIAWVGGYDFSKSQFNRIIQSKRQPGSSFKPFIYACALENGYNPASILIDSPEALAGTEEGLNWKPKNYDGEYKGPITFRASLEQSRNITTIKLAEKLGVQKISDFLNRINFNANVSPDLSLALGSFGVSLYDLVASYSIFANGGKSIQAKAITEVLDRDGLPLNLNFTLPQIAKKPLNSNEQTSKPAVTDLEAEDQLNEKEFIKPLSGSQVFDRRLAYVMTSLLKGVIQSGTAASASGLSSSIAGKTGTTNGYVDAWFVGYSPNIIAGAWTGFDDNKTIGYGETGGKASLSIWKDYMAEALKTLGEGEYEVPKGITNVLINKDTGKLTSGDDPRAFRETFVDGFTPNSRKVINNPDQQLSDPNLIEEDFFDTQ
jgi:penicillin-binding protein 1A